MRGIEIHGDPNSAFLGVSLRDILDCFDNVPASVKWCLFSLEAWIDTEQDTAHLVDLEASVDGAPHGVLVDLESLQAIATQAFQVINLIVVGSSEASRLHIDTGYRNVRHTYDYYIELLDSSFFIIYSHNHRFLECLSA